MRRIVEQRPAEHWSGDARLFVSDLNRLALARDTYDVVLAASVLHHILDLEYLIGAVYRALKPGGTLICLDHMEPSGLGRLIRYGLLTILPTEVPYWQKPVHAFKRLMARVFKYSLPQVTAPAAFTLPERSPFEDISGHQAVDAHSRAVCCRDLPDLPGFHRDCGRPLATWFATARSQTGRLAAPAG